MNTVMGIKKRTNNRSTGWHNISRRGMHFSKNNCQKRCVFRYGEWQGVAVDEISYSKIKLSWKCRRHVGDMTGCRGFKPWRPCLFSTCRFISTYAFGTWHQHVVTDTRNVLSCTQKKPCPDTGHFQLRNQISFIVWGLGNSWLTLFE